MARDVDHDEGGGKGGGGNGHLLGSGVSAVPRHPVHLGYQVGVDAGVDYCLHHGQVLEIIVRLEQGIAGEELNQDASYAPYVAGERPSEPQDDLGGSVVTGGYYRRVVFILEGSGSEIDQPDLGIEEHLSLARLADHSARGGRDLAVVGKCLVVTAIEKNILGLEVGMDEIEVVQD